MSSTVLYMSMSLDGFVAGPNETYENGLGDGGARLHEWGVLNDPDSMGEADRAVYDDFMSTGAVIAGRGTFEAAHGWSGDHHDGIQIYILSRHSRPRSRRLAQRPLRRLFDHLEPGQIELEPLQVAQGQDATHLRYRVRR